MCFRKIVSSALSAFLLLACVSVSPVQAEADGEFTILVDSVTAQAGETFEVNINLSEVPADGISGIEFAVKYDSSLITVESVTEGSVTSTGASDSEISYNINKDTSSVDLIWLTGFGSDCYIKQDGVFATITGTVNGNVSGKTELEIIPITRGDISGSNSSIYATVGDEAELLTPAVSNGTITISSGEQPDTMLGDSTCDGMVDIRDVTLMNQYVIMISDLTDQGFINSNVIKDDTVDIKDLGQLKKYTIKLVTSL